MKTCIPLGILAAAIAAVTCSACGMVPRHGESVDITAETALIIWDAESKTEHFIRKATFQSSSTEFGFLVPTPTQPELAEADEGVFDYMTGYTAAKVEYRNVKRPRPKRSEDASRAMPSAAAPGGPRGVEVLEETEVGGQEAVVLKFHRGPKSDVAEDAKELADWLTKRGYEFGPQLANWLKPYIENGWVMTAFRIARRVQVSKGPKLAVPQPAFNEMQGKAVRMSFKTEKPFYPYREPEAPKIDEAKSPNRFTPPRFLRVFFLASKRFEGTLGTGDAAWNASTPWSDKLDDGQLQATTEKLKLPPGALKNANWLTEFEDRSSPRQGTDEVYYKPSDAGAVHRPVIVHEIIDAG